jgi:hypothetical protein
VIDHLREKQTRVLKFLNLKFLSQMLGGMHRRESPDPKICRHEWVVYSTATHQGFLEVYCRNCGLLGNVIDPSKEEWARAFYAPSKPYAWNQPDRVRPGAYTMAQAMEISRKALAARK